MRRLPPAGRRAVQTGLAALHLAFLVGLLFPPEITFPLDPERIVADEGRAYLQKIRGVSRFPLALRWSTTARPQASNLVLYEDGAPLPRPSATHAEVQEQGEGRFCHCRRKLVFSTPDGTDPRTNGREYVARATPEMTPEAWSLFGLLNLLGLLLLAFRWPTDPDASKVRLHGVAARLKAELAHSANFYFAAGRPAPWFFTILAFGLGCLLAWRSNTVIEALSGRHSIDLAYALLAIAFSIALAFDLRGSLRGTALAKPQQDRRLFPHKGLRTLAACSGWFALPLLFAIPLIFTWSFAVNGRGVLGGLLPWSDALSYFRGGMEFWNEGAIDLWNQRRPLNAPWNAVRLALADADLRVALIMNATAVALLTGLAARVMRRQLGHAAGIAFIAVVFANVSSQIQKFMSESNAWLLALFAWSLLWLGAEKRHPLLFGLGMAFLSLGLNARAGPFLVIPALILWALIFRGSAGFRLPLAALAGSLVGFALPEIYAGAWSNGEGQRFGNFAHTLYGIAVGSNWAQIFVDHPEAQTYDAIYKAAFVAIREDPGVFVRSLSQRGFGFLGTLSDFFPVAKLWQLWPLLLPVLRYRDPATAMVGFGVLGILASSPILYPDGGARVYAGAGPLFAAWAAVSCHCLLAWIAALLRGAHGNDPAEPTPTGWIPRESAWVVAGVAILLAIMASPLAIAGAKENAETDTTVKCAEGETRVITDWRAEGVSVRLIPDEAREHSLSPEVRMGDFMQRFPVARLRDAFVGVTPPAELWVGAPREGPPGTWLLFDPPGSFPQDRPVTLCGRLEERKSFRLLRNPRVLTSPRE